MLSRWLPAVMLAVAAQILLPAITLQALATVYVLDEAGTLCLATPSSDAPAGQPAQPWSHHHHVCPLCQIAAAQHAAILVTPGLAPRPSKVAVVSTPVLLSWSGPRGPPLLRPPARAPPHLV